MATASDPYESYLKRAADLFEAGDIVQAGQIWQAILKKKPDHEIARAGLYKVKLHFDARATQGGMVMPKSLTSGTVSKTVPPPSVPAPVQTPIPPREPEVDVDRLLRDGCTLFDMGQMEDALKKWEQILVHEPGHALARAYVQDARKNLGLPLLEKGAEPAPVSAPAEPVARGVAGITGPEDERLDQLIRDGVQLYDMGMTLEATQKWQQVLDLAPGHRDAEAYLAMAKRDQQASAPSAKPVSAPPPAEVSGREFPERQPRHQPRYQAAQPKSAPAPILFDEPAEPAASEATALPVTPPSALTSGTQKPRKGFNLPEALQHISLPAWVASPAFILGTITGLVVLVIGSYYYLQHRKDRALRQEVAAFRASAIAPVARGSVIKSLQEVPAEIQREAQSALALDPLLAYFRAQESARLNPGDAAVAQLLERAKAGLAKVDNPVATLEDFEKQVKAGELDAADRSMTFLLSRNPDDQVLRERAGRLYLAMVQAYASKEQWTEAEEHLRRGRAMFPADRSWSAKLQLLARIRTMAKNERASWIQLLG